MPPCTGTECGPLASRGVSGRGCDGGRFSTVDGGRKSPAIWATHVNLCLWPVWGCYGDVCCREERGCLQCWREQGILGNVVYSVVCLALILAADSRLCACVCVRGVFQEGFVIPENEDQEEF